MKIPHLSVEIINSNKNDTLDVLQGISRYISAIYIQKTLIEHEGGEILNFLNSRYPTKKIIVNLTNFTKQNLLIENIVERTKIKEFVVKGNGKDANFKTMCEYLISHGAKLIFHYDSNNHLPSSFEKIHKVWYFKPENKSQLNYGTESDLQVIHKLQAKQHLIVGNIIEKDIDAFDDQGIDELVVSGEVCYSFNPVETCKSIYLKIKQHYLKSSKK